MAWFLFATERSNKREGAAGGTVLVFKDGAKGIDEGAMVGGAGDEEKAHNGRGANEEKELQKEKEEQDEAMGNLKKSRSVFSWQHLCYDIRTGEGERRRLLDDVSGYVAPGKLTALMGESGAGKVAFVSSVVCDWGADIFWLLDYAT